MSAATLRCLIAFIESRAKDNRAIGPQSGQDVSRLRGIYSREKTFQLRDSAVELS